MSAAGHRPDLDAWLADPAIRTRHRRAAAAEPDAVWDAAASVRLDETRTLGRLVQWRIPTTKPDVGFRELLSSPPFTVLAEGERWSVSGLCGQIWTTSVDYPRVDEHAFRTWDRSRTVRVLFGHWVEPDGDGRHAIVSEARVEPVDRAARWALRSLWLGVRPFERLIGAEPLSLVARRAEQQGASA
ncbi:hypothetical protein NBH00_03155 [Paraconexibacter antarcticus]|uniref:Uncharacterized protein n=1 Tax=Paraconexibacter antarcticus TaxID=2949664 RepID=A0ABY5DUP2_9ACTN|nr:hypothetical protein [Paraconexibacter antarcticus]UTI65215.1 hypothetical protein NBH00_03155 [Paraconexibacter antarcticus]